jgi:transcriptional regulator with XRE-family HTH domain
LVGVMDVRQLFAANLRRIRNERGFSQERLAYECEIDRAHVSKIERGLVFVGLEIIDKLARVLDTPHADFLKPIAKRAKKAGPS